MIDKRIILIIYESSCLPRYSYLSVKYKWPQVHTDVTLTGSMKPLFSSLIYTPAATTGSSSKTRNVRLVIANHWTTHQQPLISQIDPSAKRRGSWVWCQIIDGTQANSQAIKLKRGKRGGSGSREQQCDHHHLENNRENETFSFHSHLIPYSYKGRWPSVAISLAY